MSRKVMISVAPIAATDTVIEPKKIAAEVIACAEAGAAMVHLHVRDSNGNLTPDLSVFKETIKQIRKESDIIIEASTGGVSDLTIQERCMPLSCEEVETCSLNVGSTNLGAYIYKNPINEVKYCVEEILTTRKVPEVEIFEIGHIYAMEQLIKEFNVPKPLLYTIVLGHNGAAPATPEALMAMVQFMPEDVNWGITHANRRDFALIAAALGLGAKTVRIGFEDSYYLNDEDTADSNVPLVKKTAALIQAMDKQPMTSSEARETFHIVK